MSSNGLSHVELFRNVYDLNVKRVNLSAKRKELRITFEDVKLGCKSMIGDREFIGRFRTELVEKGEVKSEDGIVLQFLRNLYQLASDEFKLDLLKHCVENTVQLQGFVLPYLELLNDVESIQDVMKVAMLQMKKNVDHYYSDYGEIFIQGLNLLYDDNRISDFKAFWKQFIDLSVWERDPVKLLESIWDVLMDEEDLKMAIDVFKKHSDKIPTTELWRASQYLLLLAGRGSTSSLFILMIDLFQRRREKSDSGIDNVESLSVNMNLETFRRNRKLTKQWINMTRKNELPRTQFMIATLLSLATIEVLQEKIFKYILAIVKSEYDEACKNYQANRSVDGNRFLVPNAFSQALYDFQYALTTSLSSLQVVVIQLGFFLIGSKPSKEGAKEIEQHTGHSIGISLMNHIARIQPAAIATIVKRCFHEINLGGDPYLYLEFLKEIVSCHTDACYDAPTIAEQLNYLRSMEPNIAIELLQALDPLLKRSLELQEKVIIVLRKLIYSKNEGSRRLAVHGLLQILQASSEHKQQEGGEFKLMGFLQRALTLQCEVRKLIYSRLLDVMESNPNLNDRLLSVILTHTKKYFLENNAPPFDIDLCVQRKEPYVVEPFAHLLLLLVRIVLSEKFSSIPIRGEIEDIVSKICEQLTHSDGSSFRLDVENFTSDNADGLRNRHAAEIVLGSFQVAFEYFLSSDLPLEDLTNFVQDLFTSYRSLEQTAIKGSKAKKEKNAKNKKETSAEKKTRKKFQVEDVPPFAPSTLKDLVKIVLLENGWSEVGSGLTEWVLSLIQRMIKGIKADLKKNPTCLDIRAALAELTGCLIQGQVKSYSNHDSDRSISIKIAKLIQEIFKLVKMYGSREDLLHFFKKASILEPSMDYRELFFDFSITCYQELQDSESSAILLETFYLLIEILQIDDLLELKTKIKSVAVKNSFAPKNASPFLKLFFRILFRLCDFETVKELVSEMKSHHLSENQRKYLALDTESFKAAYMGAINTVDTFLQEIKYEMRELELKYERIVRDTDQEDSETMLNEISLKSNDLNSQLDHVIVIISDLADAHPKDENQKLKIDVLKLITTIGMAYQLLLLSTKFIQKRLKSKEISQLPLQYCDMIRNSCHKKLGHGLISILQYNERVSNKNSTTLIREAKQITQCVHSKEVLEKMLLSLSKKCKYNLMIGANQIKDFKWKLSKRKSPKSKSGSRKRKRGE